MPTMNEVLNDAKTLAKSYRAVLSVVAKLEEIEDLDKSYEQAEYRLREHKQLVMTAKNKTQAAQDHLEAVYDEVAKAKEKAADLVADAQADAKQMRADASHDAAAINAKSKQEVEVFHTHVRTENEKHKARMAQNATDYTEASEKLDALKAELAAMRERLGV